MAVKSHQLDYEPCDHCGIAHSEEGLRQMVVEANYPTGTMILFSALILGGAAIGIRPWAWEAGAYLWLVWVAWCLIVLVGLGFANTLCNRIARTAAQNDLDRLEPSEICKKFTLRRQDDQQATEALTAVMIARSMERSAHRHYEEY